MKKDVDRRLVVKMYLRNKLSTVQIGKIVGLSPGAVQSILRVRRVRIRSGKEAHRVRWPKGRVGKLAGNWRGGRRRAGVGGAYIAIYKPDHPFCDKDGYVMEHRLIVERRIGRFLKPSEIVHHKNGIKDDNRPKNLKYIRSKGDHIRRHFSAVKRVHELEAFIKKHGLKIPR